MSDFRERFLKKTPTKRDLEDDLFSEPTLAKAEPIASPAHGEADDFISLYQIFRELGRPNWLDQNHSKARMYFNVINLAQHPRREMAEALAICALKGTTFDDKRENCVAEERALACGESTGEVTLVHDKDNPYDSYALAVISKFSGKQLGFIPKAAGANQSYIAAMEAGRLTGAYLIEAKPSRYKGEPNALLMLATGWKNA